MTVADADSELALALAEGGFGQNVACDAPGDLVAALVRVAADAELLARHREATRWVERFAPEVVLPQFEAVLRRLTQSTPSADAGANPIITPKSAAAGADERSSS